MPEKTTYTITPGPDLLKRMPLAWTLRTDPPVHFDRLKPEPVKVELDGGTAAQLRADGYEVNPPANEAVAASGRAEAGSDAGSGIDPEGKPKPLETPLAEEEEPKPAKKARTAPPASAL